MNNIVAPFLKKNWPRYYVKSPTAHGRCNCFDYTDLNVLVTVFMVLTVASVVAVMIHVPYCLKQVPKCSQLKHPKIGDERLHRRGA